MNDIQMRLVRPVRSVLLVLVLLAIFTLLLTGNSQYTRAGQEDSSGAHESVHSSSDTSTDDERNRAVALSKNVPSLHLDPIFSRPKQYSEPAIQPQSCEERHGITYLQHFAKRSINYCTAESVSQVICFSNNATPASQDSSSLCVVKNVIHDADLRSKPFQIQCQMRDITQEEFRAGIPPFHALQSSQPNSGPGFILNEWFTLIEPERREWFKNLVKTQAVPWTLLTKRQDVATNIWHGLLEVMSTYVSLDVIQFAQELLTGSQAADLKVPDDQSSDNQKAILLDDLPSGPLIDSWQVFGSNTVIQYSKLVQSSAKTNYKHIVIPLSGESSSLWQANKTALPCTKSTLLRGFAERMLAAYDVHRVSSDYTLLKKLVYDGAIPQGSVKQPVRILFVNRLKNRRLVHQDALLKALQDRYPDDVQVFAVDLAQDFFADQLASMQSSVDMLVGVHGAGLAHGMFLKPGSAMVELMPFNSNHQEFQNMALLMGVDYHRIDTMENKKETNATGNWETDDVYITERIFLRVIEEAMAGLRPMV